MVSHYFRVESWSNQYKLRFVVCCNNLVKLVILYILYYSLFCYYVYIWWIKLSLAFESGALCSVSDNYGWSAICDRFYNHHLLKITFRMLSRRSRQRERLNALGLSICLFVCLSVCRQMQKRDFQKLSNLELWSFQRTHYRTPKIQDGGYPPSWKSTWRQFLCWRIKLWFG